MKPVLSIKDLVTNPQFGVNVVITAAIAKVEDAAILEYSLDTRKTTIHLIQEHPNYPETGIKAIVNFTRTNAPDNKAFFAKLENYEFHTHGEIQSEEFKAAFLPLYTAYLKTSLGYGDDAELSFVTVGRDNKAIIQFTSTRKKDVYDAEGNKTTVSKQSSHRVSWKLLDPKVDYNNVIVFPRPLFNTVAKFIKKVAELMDIAPERIYVKEDPTNLGVDSVEVYIGPNDLTYSGSITVSIPPAGEAVHVYNLTTGDEVLPEEGEDDETQTPPPVATITDVEFDAATKTVTALVTNATQVTIEAQGVTAKTVNVVDGIVSYMFTETLVEGTAIVIKAGTVTNQVTIPVTPPQEDGEDLKV